MNYHNRMMNIQDRVSAGMSPGENRVAYKVGHKDARHAAADIANEADAEIRRLRDVLQNIDSNELAELRRKARCWDDLQQARKVTTEEPDASVEGYREAGGVDGWHPRV